ncbi:MAG: BspA family leucine-rich repeat surface protein [Clostridia bacterium]|nr:BspA family leucine-rich repeat surface protein [Clostridia bacterium]
MTKKMKIYQTLTFVFMVTTIILLLIVGITAVQKSMKLKIGFNTEPSIYCYMEYKLHGEADTEYKPLFSNVTNTGAGLTPCVTANASLSGNTLTLTTEFEQLGASFDFRIYNYNDFKLNVTCSGLSKNTTANTSAVNVATNASPIVFTNITTGGEKIVFSFEEYILKPTYLKKGTDVNSAIGYGATSVVFGYWGDYESEVNQTWEENTTDLSIDGDGSIKIFSGKSDSKAKYILSEGIIYANEDCSKMFYCDPADGGFRATVNLSELNTSKVKNMSYMFYSYMGSSVLDLSTLDTSNVTDMSSMFYDCYTLTSLNLSGFNTSNVENMEYMFYRCYNLTSLDLSDFNTSNVSGMNYMFSSIGQDMACKTIYVSEIWSTASVTSSNGMFENCTSLVGGNGTTYNSSNVTHTYARIDTASTPGYFTLKT